MVQCIALKLFDFVFLPSLQSELTLADLSSSLHAHGIDLSKPEYFADTVFAGGMLDVQAAVKPTQSGIAAPTGNKADTKKEKKK